MIRTVVIATRRVLHLKCFSLFTLDPFSTAGDERQRQALILRLVSRLSVGRLANLLDVYRQSDTAMDRALGIFVGFMCLLLGVSCQESKYLKIHARLSYMRSLQYCCIQTKNKNITDLEGPCDTTQRHST